MFDRLPTLAHGEWVRVKALLDGIDLMDQGGSRIKKAVLSIAPQPRTCTIELPWVRMAQLEGTRPWSLPSTTRKAGFFR
jgi:hypothetical protein